MDKNFFKFLKDAYTNGLCNEYRDEIRNCHEDKLQLIRLAMRQQSIPWIATKLHDGVLTKRYVKNAFGAYLNGFILDDCDEVNGYKYTWYVDYDYDYDIVVDVDVMHVSFTKDARIIVPITKCPIIYVSNKSDVHLVCEGYNSVKVYVFDESKVTIDDSDETCDILVYRYSDNCELSKGKYCLCKNINDYRKKLRL